MFFDIDECADKSSQFDHMIPQPSEFESYAGKLGIGNETHVVVYDNHDKFGLFSAQRVWWTFRLFGHNAVSVLEGGLPKWVAEGYDISEKLVEPHTVQEQVFTAKLQPHLVKSFEDLEHNMEGSNDKFMVLDARPGGRFNGTAPEPRKGETRL